MKTSRQESERNFKWPGPVCLTAVTEPFSSFRLWLQHGNEHYDNDEADEKMGSDAGDNRCIDPRLAAHADRRIASLTRIPDIPPFEHALPPSSSWDALENRRRYGMKWFRQQSLSVTHFH